jgi:hypothetical protein
MLASVHFEVLDPSTLKYLFTRVRVHMDFASGFWLSFYVEEDVTCSLKDSPCLFPKICRKSRHSSDHNHKTWPQTWLGTRYPYDMLSFADA